MEFKFFCFDCLHRNVNCKFQIDKHAKNCKTKGNEEVKNSSAKQEMEFEGQNEVVGNYMM